MEARYDGDTGGGGGQVYDRMRDGVAWGDRGKTGLWEQLLVDIQEDVGARM